MTSVSVGYEGGGPMNDNSEILARLRRQQGANRSVVGAQMSPMAYPYAVGSSGLTHLRPQQAFDYLNRGAQIRAQDRFAQEGERARQDEADAKAAEIAAEQLQYDRDQRDLDREDARRVEEFGARQKGFRPQRQDLNFDVPLPFGGDAPVGYKGARTGEYERIPEPAPDPFEAEMLRLERYGQAQAIYKDPNATPYARAWAKRIMEDLAGKGGAEAAPGAAPGAATDPHYGPKTDKQIHEAAQNHFGILGDIMHPSVDFSGSENIPGENLSAAGSFDLADDKINQFLRVLVEQQGFDERDARKAANMFFGSRVFGEHMESLKIDHEGVPDSSWIDQARAVPGMYKGGRDVLGGIAGVVGGGLSDFVRGQFPIPDRPGQVQQPGVEESGSDAPYWDQIERGVRQFEGAAGGIERRRDATPPDLRKRKMEIMDILTGRGQGAAEPGASPVEIPQPAPPGQPPVVPEVEDPQLRRQKPGGDKGDLGKKRRQVSAGGPPAPPAGRGEVEEMGMDPETGEVFPLSEVPQYIRPYYREGDPSFGREQLLEEFYGNVVQPSGVGPEGPVQEGGYVQPPDEFYSYPDGTPYDGANPRPPEWRKINVRSTEQSTRRPIGGIGPEKSGGTYLSDQEGTERIHMTPEEVARGEADGTIDPHSGQWVNVNEPRLNRNVRLPDGRVIGAEDRRLQMLPEGYDAGQPPEDLQWRGAGSSTDIGEPGSPLRKWGAQGRVFAGDPKDFGRDPRGGEMLFGQDWWDYMAEKERSRDAWMAGEGPGPSGAYNPPGVTPGRGGWEGSPGIDDVLNNIWWLVSGKGMSSDPEAYKRSLQDIAAYQAMHPERDPANVFRYAAEQGHPGPFAPGLQKALEENRERQGLMGRGNRVPQRYE